MTDSADRLAVIADRQACTDLVYLLARAYDRGDGEMIASVFHTDAVIDYGASYCGGPDRLPEWVLSVMSRVHRSQHHISNVLMNVDGDAAHAESYFIAVQETGADELVFTFMSGRYLDSFARRDGVWKIVHRRAVFEFRHAMPANTPAAAYLGRRDRTDISYGHLAGEPA